MKKLKYISLFSGIGAFEQAFKNLGIDYTLEGFSEIDHEAIVSYCAVHGVDVSKNLGDITKIKTENLEADLITYGFACQDISMAGKQAGFKKDSNTRSSLLWEALRLIENIKPAFCIGENVKNLLSDKFKDDFNEYLLTLDNYGYNTYYKVLNASHFGIPQNRERVFIVSIRKDVDDGTFKFENGSKNTLTINDFLEDTIDPKYISDSKTQVFLNRIQNKSLAFQAEKGFKYDENNQPVFYTYPGIENKIIKLCNVNPSGEGQSGGLFRTAGLSPTLTTFGSGWLFDEKLNKVRNFQEVELWKLMGFTKEDYLIAEQAQLKDTKGKSTKRSKLYKQAGNSIVVNVLEPILKTLFYNK